MVAGARSKTKKVKSSKKAGQRGRKAGVARRRKPVESFKTYVYKTLKGSQAKDKTCKKSAMAVLDSICADVFKRVAGEAGTMMKYNKKQTMGHRDIQMACKTLMPPDIYEHVNTGAHAAVNKFMKARK